MIKDVLSDAIAKIQEYLDDPATTVCYSDELTQTLIYRALEAMEICRINLDSPE